MIPSRFPSSRRDGSAVASVCCNIHGRRAFILIGRRYIQIRLRRTIGQGAVYTFGALPVPNSRRETLRPVSRHSAENHLSQFVQLLPVSKAQSFDPFARFATVTEKRSEWSVQHVGQVTQNPGQVTQESIAYG